MGSSFSFPRTFFRYNNNNNNTVVSTAVVPLERERPPLHVFKDLKQRTTSFDSWLCPTCKWRYSRTTPECLGANCRKKKQKELA